jgi:hypothetical protein
MIRLLLGLILSAALWPALAADGAASDTPSLFRVELIVFENLDPAALQAEQWPDDPGRPPLDHALELNDLIAAATAAVKATSTVAPPPAAAPASAPVPTQAQAAPASPALPAWRWLAPNQLRLKPEEQKLAASAGYHPLLHVGWIQPLDSSGHGTTVHIYDGMQPQGSSAAGSAPPVSPRATVAPPFDAPSAPAAGGTPADAAGTPPPHTLDGTFTLWQGRFLHADVDLGYRRTYVPPPPAATAPPAAGAAQAAAPPAGPEPVTLYVRMTESRRLRSDELHYLDHPLFGVLMTVSPYEDAAK